MKVSNLIKKRGFSGKYVNFKGVPDDEMLNDFLFSIDWLSCRLPFNDVSKFFRDISSICKELSFDNFAFINSALHFYRKRFCLHGEFYIQVAYNPDWCASDCEFYSEGDPMDEASYYTVPLLADENDRNNGIFVQISGEGIRYLNQFPGVLERLFKYFYSCGAIVSRLDIAADCFNPFNDYVPILQSAFLNCINMKKGEYAITSFTRLNNNNVRPTPVQFKENDLAYDFHNIEFGNHGSSYGMFRLYDKFIQIKESHKPEIASELLKCAPEKYWVRLEIELHRDNASPLFNAIMSEKCSIANAWAIGVDNMFRVIVPMTSNSRRDTCPKCQIWVDFINLLKKDLHLSKRLCHSPYVERSVDELLDHCLHMSRSFSLFLEALAHRPDLVNFFDQRRRTLYENDVSYRHKCDELSRSVSA